METEIIEFLQKLNLSYVKINLEANLKFVHEFFIQNCDENVNIHKDAIVLFYYGKYYEKINWDCDLMMKYYLAAISAGNSLAMISLGTYYKKQCDYDNMMKYYLMAIEREIHLLWYVWDDILRTKKIMII